MSTLKRFFMTEVILAVFCTLAMVAAIAWIWIVFRAWKQQNESRKNLEAAIETMTGEVRKMSEHAAAQVKMLTGLIDVSKVQVEHLDRFTVAVEQFRKGLLVVPPGDNFQEYDEDAAGREGEIQEYMRNGMPRKEAEDRVGQADIWRNLKVRG